MVEKTSPWGRSPPNVDTDQPPDGTTPPVLVAKTSTAAPTVNTIATGSKDTTGALAVGDLVGVSDGELDGEDDGNTDGDLVGAVLG